MGKIAGSFFSSLKTSTQKKQWSVSYALFSKCLDACFRPRQEQANALLIGLVKQRDYERALQVRVALGRHRYTYDYEIIQSVTTLENVLRVRQIIAEMRENKVKPNEVTFQKLMELFLGGDDLKEANRDFDQMAALKVEPDKVIYSKLTDLFVEIEDLGGADLVFKLMVESKVKPNEETYNKLINLHVRKEHTNGVIKLFDEMHEAGLKPNVNAVEFLLQDGIKVHHAGSVFRVFQIVKGHKLHLTHTLYDESLSILLNKNHQGAFEVAEYMRENHAPLKQEHIDLLNILRQQPILGAAKKS